MIGLTGTHRTGKTTLAKAYADKYNVPMLQTAVSKVLQQQQIKIDESESPRQRLDAQWRVLEHLREVYESSPTRKFITDRTPMCTLGYMYTEVTQTPETAAIAQELEQYYASCVSLTQEFFEHLVIVPIAIPVEPAPGKGALCPAVMRLQENVIAGAAYLNVPAQTSTLHAVDLDLRLYELHRIVRSADD